MSSPFCFVRDRRLLRQALSLVPWRGKQEFVLREAYRERIWMEIQPDYILYSGIVHCQEKIPERVLLFIFKPNWLHRTSLLSRPLSRSRADRWHPFLQRSLSTALPDLFRKPFSRRSRYSQRESPHTPLDLRCTP